MNVKDAKQFSSRAIHWNHLGFRFNQMMFDETQTLPELKVPQDTNGNSSSEPLVLKVRTFKGH